MKHCLVAPRGLALLLILALTGCGGGTLSLSQNRGAVDTAQTEMQPLATLNFKNADVATQPARQLSAADSSLDALGSPIGPGTARGISSAGFSPGLLPPLPDESRLARQASVAYTDPADPGSPAAKSANVATAAGSATLTSSAKIVSWAYYGIPITGTKTPATLTISGSLPHKANGFLSGIYIGLADYTTGRWQIQPNIYNLSAPAVVPFLATENYHSAGKNLYVLVATFNGDIAQISSIQTSGDDSNVAPTARLTVGPAVAYTNALRSVDASASTDSDGFIVKYEFDFGDGAGFINNGNQPTVLHTFANPGARIVQVRVTDEGHLSSTAQFVVQAVDLNSFLPLSWYEARHNGDLDLATMGGSDIFGTGIVFPAFYFAGVTDLRTKLPGYFDGWYTNPEDFPVKVNAEGNAIHSATGLQDLLLDANAKCLTSEVITRQTFNPALDPTKPLSTAIAAMVAAGGDPPLPATYEAAVSSMPLNQQKPLARLVLACNDALTKRQAAFDALGLDAASLQNLVEGAQGDPLGGILGVDTGQYFPLIWDVTGGNFVLAGFPYADSFFTGSAEITDALDQLSAFEQSNPAWQNVSLVVDTKRGRIAIGGTGDDTFTEPADGNGYALLIDLGGNDTYNCRAGGTASGPNGVSLCVDMSGNDTYNRLDDPNDVDRTQSPSNDDTSQQGAGRFGIGMLVDYSGNDNYHSVRMSQGSGVIGVGLLADMDGDDNYDMEVLGQGAALAGIGILYDKAGVDTYTGYSKVQGFGGIMGIGMLIDEGTGGDIYMAIPDSDPTKPEYTIFNKAELKNTSLAQGTGMGSRWNLLGSAANPLFSSPEVGGGGYGLLYDGGGSDNYTCGYFGQGCGFYQATGVLIDRGGDDTYNGHSVAQGVAVDTGLACLLDLTGGDHYSITTGPGIGAGDNWAIGWLLDLQGDDHYDTAGLGLGAGRNNGFGYFLDYAGVDDYSGHTSGFQDSTLAAGNLGSITRPPAAPCYGIFVENAGTDTYALPFANMAGALPGPPGDSKTWVRKVSDASTAGTGSGIDVP